MSHSRLNLSASPNASKDDWTTAKRDETSERSAERAFFNNEFFITIEIHLIELISLLSTTLLELKNPYVPVGQARWNLVENQGLFHEGEGVLFESQHPQLSQYHLYSQPQLYEGK
jgi:hypothetical protein